MGALFASHLAEARYRGTAGIITKVPLVTWLKPSVNKTSNKYCLRQSNQREEVARLRKELGISWLMIYNRFVSTEQRVIYPRIESSFFQNTFRFPQMALCQSR